jgi:hypothetical protein
VMMPLKATMPPMYTLANLFLVWTASVSFMADLSEMKCLLYQSNEVYTYWQHNCQLKLTLRAC